MTRRKTIQKIEYSGSSSDVSVNRRSDLQEVIQKLRKVDPDVLILNYSQDANYDVSTLRTETEDSDEMLEKRETDLFIFAGYVPPGKHTILVRDQGNSFANERRRGSSSIVEEWRKSNPSSPLNVIKEIDEFQDVQ